MFSERADKTGGSSARIRAGERLSVRELLYGLMLPSGNDASIALAEQFGGRFAKTETRRSRSAGLVRRRDEPHRESLGHGAHERTKIRTASPPRAITAPPRIWRSSRTRRSSFPSFASTSTPGSTAAPLTGPGGYRRNIVWKNTNQLLGIQGYHGIKTGTTSAAGACLVSLGEREREKR